MYLFGRTPRSSLLLQTPPAGGAERPISYSLLAFTPSRCPGCSASELRHCGMLRAATWAASTQLDRVESVEKDREVLEQCIRQKQGPYAAQLSLLDETPGVG